LRIAINAISLRRGGVVVAFSKLLSHFIEVAPEHDYYVLANNALPRLHDTHPHVHYQYFRWAENGYGRMALWYAAVLPVWLARERIDVLFSQTSYLPLFSPVPTVMLVQASTFFYDYSEYLSSSSSNRGMSFWMKRFWSHHSVAAASRILVQSESLKRRIVEKIPSAAHRITTIPHGPGCFNGSQHPIRVSAPSDSLEIAYVAIYQEYKNFEVLLQALRILHDKGIPARLHLTLDLVVDPGARRVISRAREIGVEHWIVNHGELEPDRVVEVYESAHVFVFPSVCESFGFPQVEAMAFGLPLLASDTKVNREVCGNAAKFFAPHNQAELAASLEHLYRNPRELTSLAERSARRGHDFDWTRAAAETLQCLVRAQGGRN
jgi:glycosyltransferase involved in cell wall biosynthesis